MPTSAVGEPGIQGATVAGMQGMGVSTPSAAAVAATTLGLAILLHIPNGKILTIGLLSIIVAIGRPLTSVRLAGNTLSTEGARPKEQHIVAPVHTAGQLMVTPQLPPELAGGFIADEQFVK